MNPPILNSMEENACGCIEEAVGTSIDCLCPATAFVKMIGRKHVVRILTTIGKKEIIRFSDLRHAVDEMSSSTLSIRLTELKGAGLIRRHTFAEAPPRVEYSLTDEGERLRGSIFSFSTFALRQ
jgi:DNA-binding HxlR family transcriptional regulator